MKICAFGVDFIWSSCSSTSVTWAFVVYSSGWKIVSIIDSISSFIWAKAPVTCTLSVLMLKVFVRTEKCFWASDWSRGLICYKTLNTRQSDQKYDRTFDEIFNDFQNLNFKVKAIKPKTESADQKLRPWSRLRMRAPGLDSIPVRGPYSKFWAVYSKIELDQFWPSDWTWVECSIEALGSDLSRYILMHRPLNLR